MIPSRLFGKEVKIEKRMDFSECPMLWGNEYSITRAEVDGCRFVAVEPKEHVRLPELSQVLDGLATSERRPCVVVCRELTSYQKRRLTERNIPWFSSERSCYLPFMAIAR